MAADTLSALATLVGARLKAAHAMLATAESCTGGGIASAVTAISGSSEWFDRGFVTYSNRAKQDMLGVSGDSLERHGAVSEPVAREMALGALRNSQAQWSVAVTGIAGPTGGSEAKPVGTVCLGWAGPQGARVVTRHFAGNRDDVRRQTVIAALQGIIESLEEVAK